MKIVILSPKILDGIWIFLALNIITGAPEQNEEEQNEEKQNEGTKKPK